MTSCFLCLVLLSEQLLISDSLYPDAPAHMVQTSFS